MDGPTVHPSVRTSMDSTRSAASSGSARDDTLTHAPTPTRLKRLSLVARRDSGIYALDSPRSGRGSPSTTAFADDSGITASPSSASPPGPSAASPLRRRERPSSISYSPRPERPGSIYVSSAPRMDSLGLESPTRQAKTSGPKAPLTLAEQHVVDDGMSQLAAQPTLCPRLTPHAVDAHARHADLLRAIAARERRVTELRQELAQQEEALASLRSRWTSIANNAATTTTMTPSAPALRHTHARSGSTPKRDSSSVSSIASLPTVPDEDGVVGTMADDEPTALGALWSVISQDADDTIAEGKRFWGQLMRTVGAAAGGTVPEHERRQEPTERGRKEEERAVGKENLNMAGLRTMLPSVSLPFSTAPAPTSPPSRPMNSTSPPLRPGSIRLHRASLSPSPASRSVPLSRSLSGQSVMSNASNASMGSLASQISAGASGTTASPGDTRRNRNSWADGSPSRSPIRGPAHDAKAQNQPPSPVNVVLDSVLW